MLTVNTKTDNFSNGTIHFHEDVFSWTSDGKGGLTILNVRNRLTEDQVIIVTGMANEVLSIMKTKDQDDPTSKSLSYGRKDWE